jgi:hypothetical protein
MRRFRKPVIGIVAAATVAAAGLAATPPASAMSPQCVVRWTLWDVYAAMGEAFYALGNKKEGDRWYDTASGVILGC